MIAITGKLEAEIRSRLQSPNYASVEDLLGRALQALDAADSWLEQQLLKGL